MPRRESRTVFCKRSSFLFVLLALKDPYWDNVILKISHCYRRRAWQRLSASSLGGGGGLCCLCLPNGQWNGGGVQHKGFYAKEASNPHVYLCNNSEGFSVRYARTCMRAAAGFGA